MKEKKYFYASVENNINIKEVFDKIDANKKRYDSFSKCILYKVPELMDEEGIKPTVGILTDAESEKKEYTIIERVDNQFSKLNCNLYIYCILEKWDREKLKERRIFRIKTIDNLYEYLKNRKSFNLIENDNIDKTWYNVPRDNSDIIQKHFLSIITLPKKEKKAKTAILKKLFPDQLIIIKKLEKLMFKMSTEEFIDFINTIYDKSHYMLNYVAMDKMEEKYFVKSKIKKIISK